MKQRLIWNFEFTPTKVLPLATLKDKKDGDVKWELRYFWSNDEIITLNSIDSSLLEIANYRQKHKDDYYYLLAGHDYNIKRRHEQLFYKPLLKHENHAVGYGKKIILEKPQAHPEQAKLTPHDLSTVMKQIEKEGVGIQVKKEAFIYKFPTTPTIKIELARLEVLQKIYFSVCVEGRSLYLVETISKHLMDEHVSCEYVTFLKNILKL